MDEIARILRETREEQGRSLEELQKETKIRIRWLRALESGEHDAFPAQVYLKGFLQSYGDALGLDGCALVQKWRQESGIGVEPDDDGNKSQDRPISSWARSDTRGLSQLFNRPTRRFRQAPIFILIAALMVAGIWWLWQEGAAVEPPEDDPPLIADPGDDEQPGDDDDDQVPGDDETPLPAEIVIERIDHQDSGDVTYVVHGAETISLSATVRVGNECWVRVFSDGPQIYEGTMRSGDSRIWTASRELIVRVGWPPGLDLIINDQAVERLESTTALYLRVQANP